jgi:hypothetical protein
MSMKLIKQLFSLSLMAIALLGGVFDTSAHHAVIRVNLEEMTTLADSVFMGRCVSVEETREMVAGGNLPITRYTFEVTRAVKGKMPKQITFTQVGHAPQRAIGKGDGIVSHGMKVKNGAFLHGASAYRVGDEMVLFLNAMNSGTRVSSPVGLYQGAFFVSQMPSGQKLLRNSINNLGLFTARYTGAKLKESEAKLIFPDQDDPVGNAAGISLQSASLSRKRGSLPLEEFLSLVEQINIAHGGERGQIAETRNGKGAISQ